MAKEPLSYMLKNNGFFYAFGTSEWSGGKQSPDVVKKGEPCTWNIKNDTIAVYDEEGLPWIRTKDLLPANWAELMHQRFNMKQEAYVPHSNDGGIFKKIILEQTGVVI